jgi:predicted  nucleic acid-binding Zn-ribbon protein
MDIEIKYAELEQRCKSNTHRIDKLEQRQDNLDKLITSVEVLATKQNDMETDIKEIKCDVKSLAEKPGKRWEGLVEKIAWMLMAALIGFALSRIGLS